MSYLLATIILAIAPSLVLLAFLLAHSKVRKPILLAFAAGYFAPIPALLVELIIPSFTGASTLINAAYRSYFVAGLIEEGTKIALIVLAIRRLSSERTPAQVLSVAAAAALGFAAFENLLYVGQAPSILLLRGITAVPIHTTTAVIMAHMLKADALPSHQQRIANIPRPPTPNPETKLCVAALATGIAIHGTYDLFLAFSPPITYVSLVIVAISVYVAVNIAATARRNR